MGKRILVLLLIFGAFAVVPVWATATAEIPSNLKTAPVAEVVIPVQITDTDPVEMLDLEFTYDETVLIPLAAYRTSSTEAFLLSADLGVAGIVLLSLTSDTPLDASAGEEVAWLLFEVIGPGGSFSDLTWNFADVNEVSAASLEDGRVSVVASPSIVSVPDDVQAQPGVPLMVPVETNDATGAESFDIRVRYNSAVVLPTGVQKSALTQSMTLNYFLGIPGEVRVSLFAIQPISGGGPIVQITFDPVGSFGAVTPLDLSKGVMNEGVIPTSLDDGLLVICDAADGDTDGFSGCAGDCDNDNNEIFPGATEVCDLIDNDCDGAVDNGVAPPVGTPELLLDDDAGGYRLDWSSLADATGYDVVRGDLTALRLGAGDFTGAVEVCLLADQDDLTLVDGDTVSVGSGRWYLVRGVNCGGDASYDTDDLSLVESRDAEIEAAVTACP